MVVKMQGKKLSKRTTNKQSFKKFVESGYVDFEAFKKACRGDENLLIYTCLKKEELLPFIEKLKEIDTIEAQLKYLKNPNVQPSMNENEERYNICVQQSIPAFLKNYIAYNGFKMNNSSGDAEDWTSEFWLKYVKICNFYRDRWFHPESLKKASKVVYDKMLYKEFIYICRMSITGERRHQAFLATQRPESSLFKPSLDFNLENKGNTDRSLMDITKDTKNDASSMIDHAHTNTIIEKALEYAKLYENGQYYNQIADVYLNQDIKGINKKVLMLSKIFLYKAGLNAPKVLTFIKSLSNTYKAKFNISNSLVIHQLNEAKKRKTAHKIANYNDLLEDNGKTRLGLLLRRRSGE